QGNDVAFLGVGDDTFLWDPGDGSDTVEGQDGIDTLLFNGANISESFDISANGARARFTRDIAAIVMDLNDVESIPIKALGGAAGSDVLDGSLTPAGSMLLTLDGGADDDVLLGGDGDDILLGGLGDDVLFGGPGNDTLDGGAGDNVLVQGPGNTPLAAPVTAA